MRGERRRVVTYETDVGKEKEKKKEKECGQNIDGRACVCLMSAEDSSHSTSLTQIQTSQEADGALQKELKEGKKGK